MTARGPEPHGGLGIDNLRAELPGLIGRPSRQILSAHATGKAQIVAVVIGTGSGLSADSLRLDDDRAASLRRQRSHRRR